MVAVAPDDPPAAAEALSWLRAVAPFESTGEAGVAAAGYAAAVARWPEDPRVWTALGNARYLQQAPPAARAAYERALALAPDHWPARNNLVSLFIAQQCPALAETWIDAAGVPRRTSHRSGRRL